VERNLFRFKVDLERKVADRWWVFATPSLRVYDYVSGRLDDIYAITTGLRYDITRDVSLTSSVGYESRNSSSSSRNFNNMVVGLSLDFSYTLFSAGKDDKLWRTLERPSCEDQSQLSC